jgi:hypothetical protein
MELICLFNTNSVIERNKMKKTYMYIYKLGEDL